MELRKNELRGRKSSRRSLDKEDIFEERPRNDLQGGRHSSPIRQRNQRQFSVDIFGRRPDEIERLNEIHASNITNAEEEEELEEVNSEDYCWLWDENNKSNDVVVQSTYTEVYFHPDYSCGTAAIRGLRQLREGEEHYWEIKMSSAVYGTDMMIGVGSSSVDLNKYKSQFCSIIGKNTDSWGISYFGTLHHNGKTREYTKKFERGAIIGCHLDLWKGTLSFYKNGEPLGVAFEGLLGKSLYPMISSTAARTKMKLLCSYKTSFSLQYLCCKEISKNIPSTPQALASLPLPNGLKRYISWRLDWVFKLNNPGLSSGIGPRRKRVRRKVKKQLEGTEAVLESS